MLGPSPSNPPLAFPCGTDTPQKGFLLSTIPKPTMRHQVTETRLGCIKAQSDLLSHSGSAHRAPMLQGKRQEWLPNRPYRSTISHMGSHQNQGSPHSFHQFPCM